MENRFIVNIIHRPELSPEYAEKALGTADGVRDGKRFSIIIRLV